MERAANPLTSMDAAFLLQRPSSDSGPVDLFSRQLLFAMQSFKEGNFAVRLPSDLTGVEGDLQPSQDVTLTARRKDGTTKKAIVTLRADTPIEIEYLKHGGILPYVLREIMAQPA